MHWHCFCPSRKPAAINLADLNRQATLNAIIEAGQAAQPTIEDDEGDGASSPDTLSEGN